jgi:ribosome-associated protein
MDIKKLQASVIDALEDVKAQDIRVFDTVHLTSLFDRLAIASGTSNRQTKALAASVRDKVKENGGTVISMEGEDTGEWVLVDLGDMVVHIMQPAIRAYYRLEEIWGDKEIDLAAAKKPAKRTATKTVTKSHISGAAKNTVAKKAPAKKAATKTTTGKTTAAKKTAAKKTATKATASKSTAAAKKAPAKRAAKSA